MSKPTMTSLQSEINSLKTIIEDLGSRLRRLENGLYAGMGSIILLLIGLLVR
jgi:hypothetical protein